MTDLEKINSIYLLGIGGIGMSALARYFFAQGKSVYGYDKTCTDLTESLNKEGIPVHYTEDIGSVPDDIDLVIYTPAVPKDNKEYAYFIQKGFPVKKRSEILGMLTADKFTIAVAGTHGKTTITSMIAHILKTDGRNVNAFVGGIAKNYHSNIILSDECDILVVEADEYDRSFLQLYPDIIVISSIDPDHLDIYGNKDELQQSFLLFIKQMAPNGKLVIHDTPNIEVPYGYNVVNYSMTEDTEIRADDIRLNNGRYIFNIKYYDKTIEDIELGMPGKFNIENAIAASAVGLMMGANEKSIFQAFKSYQGVERRFDVRLNTDKIIYIDDYAHHPEEINACIEAVKDLFPEKKITGIFQPHLYSRTRDLAEGFADSLKMLDRVILLDIYPAREQPLEGVDSNMLLMKIDHAEKSLCSKEGLIEDLKSCQVEVLLTLGAGDIDLLVQPIEKVLRERIKSDMV